MPNGVSGIILAGGRSRRMARSKAFLPWGGTTLIEHVVERLRSVTDELIVAVKDSRAFQHLQVRVVEDGVPKACALAGLYAGLRAASYDLSFVCACDTPFVNPAMIQLLLQHAEGYDAVIPRTADGPQPLHAVYRKRILPVLGEQLRRRQFTLAKLVERLHVHVLEPQTFQPLDPQGVSFLNMNTPNEYLAARALLL